MAEAYKRSSIQGTSSVSTYATLYQVPASTQAVLSTISICNTASVSGTYRVGFASGASDPAIADFLVYGATVAANDTTFLTVGVSLSSGTFIRVSSSSTNIVFNTFISEIT